jgi:hypothetical protein
VELLGLVHLGVIRKLRASYIHYKDIRQVTKIKVGEHAMRLSINWFLLVTARYVLFPSTAGDPRDV